MAMFFIDFNDDVRWYAIYINPSIPSPMYLYIKENNKMSWREKEKIIKMIWSWSITRFYMKKTQSQQHIQIYIPEEGIDCSLLCAPLTQSLSTKFLLGNL